MEAIEGLLQEARLDGDGSFEVRRPWYASLSFAKCFLQLTWICQRRDRTRSAIDPVRLMGALADSHRTGSRRLRVDWNTRTRQELSRGACTGHHYLASCCSEPARRLLGCTSLIMLSFVCFLPSFSAFEQQAVAALIFKTPDHIQLAVGQGENRFQLAQRSETICCCVPPAASIGVRSSCNFEISLHLHETLRQLLSG